MSASSNGRVRQGAMWSATNTIAMKFATIAVTAVVVRIVTPHDFGVFAVAATIYAVVSSFAELGLSSCLARRDFNPDEVGPTVVAVALISSVALAAGMAGAARPLADAMGAPGAEHAIWVLSLSVLLGGVFTAPTSLLVRNFRQSTLFASTAIAFVPSNLVLIVLAIHGDGAMAFAWSRVIGQLVAGLFLTWRVKQRYWPRVDRRWLGIVLRFGLPLAGANLVNYALLNADYAFVGHKLGPTLLGIYMLAFNVASWSTSVLSSTVNSVAMPAFSQARADPEMLHRMLSSATRLVCLVAFPISALTLALARPLVHTVYGSQWMAAVPVLRVLAGYGALFVVTLLFSNMLVGTGRAGRLFIIQLVWIAFLIPAMTIGGSVMGITGVAVSHIVILTFVIIPIYGVFAARLIPSAVRITLRAAAAPLFVACVGGLAAWGLSSVTSHPLVALASGGCAGVIVYLVGTFGMLREYLPGGVSARLANLYYPYDLLMKRMTFRRSRPLDAAQIGGPHD